MVADMKAIDLLLAAGDSVEKVHQTAWYALLKNSGLLPALGIEEPAEPDLIWEPNGGTFDLAVKGRGKTVWIELKVDSGLSQAQLNKQSKHGKDGHVVYALLGLAAVRSRPWATDIIEERGGKVVTGKEVSEALEKVARSGELAESARGLALAYGRQLRTLMARGMGFRSTEKWWGAHNACFYEELRQGCSAMKKAIITYVPNPSGGFEACHWGWVDADDETCCYLQWEGTKEGAKLCFKISVRSRATRGSVRSAAVDFLRDKSLAQTKVKRPARLGSGHTMTVGFVDDLPIRDQTKWSSLLAAMSEATRLNAQLAKRLRSR